MIVCCGDHRPPATVKFKIAGEAKSNSKFKTPNSKLLLWCSEQREVDAAVCSVFDEAGYGAEVVLLAMLEDQ